MPSIRITYSLPRQIYFQHKERQKIWYSAYLWTFYASRRERALKKIYIQSQREALMRNHYNSIIILPIETTSPMANTLKSCMALQFYGFRKKTIVITSYSRLSFDWLVMIYNIDYIIMALSATPQEALWNVPQSWYLVVYYFTGMILKIWTNRNNDFGR